MPHIATLQGNERIQYPGKGLVGFMRNNFYSLVQLKQSMEQSQITHILHHKPHTLASSLLLTASLLTHQQVRRQRSPAPSPLPPCLLTASKLNISTAAPPKTRSNIQELKCQARRLQQQDMAKMGKENQSIQYWDEPDQIQSLGELCNKHKKMNRRKIVKGRPEMYILLKKRKMIEAVGEQQNTGQTAKRQQALQDILQNQLLIQLATTQHSKIEVNLPPQRFRRSSATLEKKIESSQEERWKARGPSQRQLSVNHKRYSGFNTIQ